MAVNSLFIQLYVYSNFVKRASIFIIEYMAVRLISTDISISNFY